MIAHSAQAQGDDLLPCPFCGGPARLEPTAWLLEPTMAAHNRLERQVFLNRPNERPGEWSIVPLYTRPLGETGDTDELVERYEKALEHHGPIAWLTRGIKPDCDPLPDTFHPSHVGTLKVSEEGGPANRLWWSEAFPVYTHPSRDAALTSLRAERDEAVRLKVLTHERWTGASAETERQLRRAETAESSLAAEKQRVVELTAERDAARKAWKASNAEYQRIFDVGVEHLERADAAEAQMRAMREALEAIADDERIPPWIQLIAVIALAPVTTPPAETGDGQ
jgi:hypothetical protein